MKIVLLSFAVPWEERPTNGLYNVAQCGALKELGHDAEVVSVAPMLPRWAGRFSAAARRQIERPDAYTQEGVLIRTLRVPFAFPRVLRERIAPMFPRCVLRAFCVAASRVVTTHLRTSRPDALVVHGVMPWGDLAVRAAEKLGIPVVFIEHSYDDVQRVRPGAMRDAYLSIARRARCVLTVSGAMTEHLRDQGVDNVRTIVNGVSIMDSSELEEIRDEDREPSILCAGQFVERKGHEVLLRAFARIDRKDVTLKIVGEPPERIRRLASDLGLEPRIEWLPTMTNRELLREMARSTVFVLPSWNEAFGLVYMEALGTGTPVIMTSDCGAAEHVGHGLQGWIVRPRDVDALRSSMERAFAQSPASTRAMGDAGRALVKRGFTWASNARTLHGAIGW